LVSIANFPMVSSHSPFFSLHTYGHSHMQLVFSAYKWLSLHNTINMFG
jgi:hypothetical protein